MKEMEEMDVNHLKLYNQMKYLIVVMEDYYLIHYKKQKIYYKNYNLIKSNNK